MKKATAIGLLFCMFFFKSFSQGIDLNGSWNGSLLISGQKLPLVFNFETEGGEWKGTMDSPAQGARGIPLKKVLFNGLMLTVEVDHINATYEAVVVMDTLKGSFSQSGMLFDLNLAKMDLSEFGKPNRPQEPKPPFAYEVTETTFTNSEEGITLQGTITKPKGTGPFPSVVLITGSGPQNRDGELMDHKPLLVMADYLTRNGIVVFRFDERGVGESQGNFSLATTEDFKNDVALALEHLRKFPFVDQVRSGVIGHSEGGMISWILGAQHPGLAFIVSLAGPVVPIHELMKQQTRDMLESSGVSQEMLDQQTELNDLVYQTFKETDNYREIRKNLNKNIQEYLSGEGVDEALYHSQYELLMESYQNLLTPWFYNFLRFDPLPFIEKLELPVLAAFGGKDIQVNAMQNEAALRKIITEKDKNNIEIIIYPELNHLFQKSETGSVLEYSTNTETFNQKVMEDIVTWIKNL